MDDSLHWASGRECWILFLYCRRASRSRSALVNREPSHQTTPAVSDASYALVLTPFLPALAVATSCAWMQPDSTLLCCTWGFLASAGISLAALMHVHIWEYEPPCTNRRPQINIVLFPVWREQSWRARYLAPQRGLSRTKVHLPPAVTSVPSFPITLFPDSHSFSLGALT